MKTKKCSKCKRILNVDQFGKCSSHKDGLQYRCKSCVVAGGKKWRKENPNYGSQYYNQNSNKMKHNMSSRYRELKTNEPWQIMYKAIKQRAKERNLAFDLDPEYIKSLWTDMCPVFGIPLKCAVFESGLDRQLSKAKPTDNSPTLDRINSNMGYVKGNVCIISYRANMIKNCGTLDEHKMIVDFFMKQLS